MKVPTSIVAGTVGMPTGKFFVGIVFPLSLWIVVFTTLGGTFGHFTPQIELSPNRFLLPLGIPIAFGILTGILYMYSKKGPRNLKRDK